MQAAVSAIVGALETLADTVAKGAAAESAALQVGDVPDRQRATNAEYVCSARALTSGSAAAVRTDSVHQADPRTDHDCKCVASNQGHVPGECVHWPSALANAPNGCPAVLAEAEDSSSAQALSAAQVQAVQDQIASAFKAKQTSKGTVRCWPPQTLLSCEPSCSSTRCCIACARRMQNVHQHIATPMSQ